MHVLYVVANFVLSVEPNMGLGPYAACMQLLLGKVN